MNAETETVRSAASQLNGRKDKLVADIKTVVTDAEDLLRQAKASGSEGYANVRADLEERLAETVMHLQEIQEILQRSTDSADAQLGSDVYEQLRFDLCPDCRKRFLLNPLGRELAKQFDFSKN